MYTPNRVSDASKQMDLVAVGVVVSPLASTSEAPRQPDEGAPSARIAIHPAYRAALEGLRAGDAVIVITWLDLLGRETLTTHPRGDPARPAIGVFATRSADRPNPVGLHEVTITAIDPTGFDVDALEAIDGTLVIDIKPRLAPVDQR